jgi:hypothetical protein
MNGEDKSGDGGGGGGGGGGRYGGRGGDLSPRGGDQGGTAGETGASYWNSSLATAGVVYSGLSVNPSKGDSIYDLGDFAKGGVRSGSRAGGDGYVVLEFEYIPLPRFKGADGWTQFTNAYVKFANSWKPIINTWVKVGNAWKPVTPIANVSFTDSGTGIVAGGTRSFVSWVDD